MKSDFALAKDELNRIGIRKVCEDFYQTPQRKGNVFFVKSPAGIDRTASLALYPSSNRFTDFSNGNLSGDCIAFVAYIKGVNQWQSLKELQTFYGLMDSREADRQEAQRRIQQQQQQEQERKKEERKQAFYLALYGEIDRLKRWEAIYKEALEKNLFEPLSDLWAYCVDELQKTDYRLNILTGADVKAYPRLKAFHEKFPSDRSQWILDCLAILQESGAFTATENETKEITAQRDWELTRKHGQIRRCSIAW